MKVRSEQEIIALWQDVDKPIVSVSCSTYNHELYIAQAIESFLMQETNFPFEILVRDDCSTDNTADIVRGYAEKYPAIIKPIFEEKNTYQEGPKPASVLFPKAVGKYIAMCEGDDYWTSPEKLQKQVDVFEEHESVSICFHPAESIDQRTNESKIVAQHFLINTEVSSVQVILGGGEYMPTPSIMFKNSNIEALLDLLGSFTGGDFFLQMFMATSGIAYFLKEPMCVYRLCSSGSWSTRMVNDLVKFNSFRLELIGSLASYRGKLKKKEEQDAMYRRMIGYGGKYLRSASNLSELFCFILKLSKSVGGCRGLFFVIIVIVSLRKNILSRIVKYLKGVFIVNS